MSRKTRNKGTLSNGKAAKLLLQEFPGRGRTLRDVKDLVKQYGQAGARTRLAEDAAPRPMPHYDDQPTGDLPPLVQRQIETVFTLED